MQPKFLTLVLLSLLSVGVFSQSFSFEAGFNLGTASFQTDYGQRGDFKSGVTGNMGLAVGGAVYMNFFGKAGLWNDRADIISTHFKLKGEVSYMKANLEHFGSYVEETSTESLKLKATHGSTSVLNTGITFEYHFNDIANFSSKRNQVLDPYIGIGGLISYSKPTFESDLGDYKSDPSLLPTVYQNDAVFTDPSTSFSALFSLGSRIKAGEKGDFVVDARWQMFTSNTVDGLDPKLNANKFNDWAFAATVGYVFYFN